MNRLDKLIDFIILHDHTGKVIAAVWLAIVVLGAAVWACFQPEVDPLRWMLGL